MSKFNLNTLAAKLSEKSGLSATEAELFIRNMFDVCHQGLEADKQVKVRWLGTFKVTSVKDRESVDVNTGERIVIEGRDKISFTPDNILKEIVNKPFAQFETVVVNDGVEFDAIDKKFDTELSETNDSDEEQPVVEQPIVEVVSTPHPQPENQGVIDFLDTPNLDTPSCDVIVIGEEQEVQNSQKSEEEQVPQEPAESQEVMNVPEAHESEEVTVADKAAAEEDKPAETDAAEEDKVDETDEAEEVEDEIRRHHFILPKYAVVAACFVVLALVAAIGWFAFTYGQMAAQRDHLAMQLERYKSSKAAATKVKTQEQILKEKAKEDSLRMLQVSEVIENAEKAGKDSVAAQKSAKNTIAENPKADKDKNAAKEKLAKDELTTKKKQEAEKLAKQQQQAKAKEKQAADAKASETKASKYDSDPRVRTGAYSIVGVAQTITVTDGQSLAAISKKYLGPGMECYIEALNGTSTVKSGQKIKIPKLELKKKRK